MNLQTDIFFTGGVAFSPGSPLTRPRDHSRPAGSRLRRDWALIQTHLSRFFVRRFLSIPSIKFSKHKCMACCFSGGWLLTMLFLRSAKYCRDTTGLRTHVRWRRPPPGAAGYLLVEQDEAQERPGHGPLVPAVFEDDDVQHCGQHLQHDDNRVRVKQQTRVGGWGGGSGADLRPAGSSPGAAA